MIFTIFWVKWTSAVTDYFSIFFFARAKRLSNCRSHCSKFSFFVQNRDFYGWKTRENVVVSDFLAVDIFDFTRKIVKKILCEKLVKMLGFCQNWIFGQKIDFLNSVRIGHIFKIQLFLLRINPKLAGTPCWGTADNCKLLQIKNPSINSIQQFLLQKIRFLLS